MIRWYFARPTSDTATAFEVAVREHFEVLHLENPNADLHQHGFSSLGVEYLFFAIAMLPAYDACVALPLPNGRWSAGVAREVNWFLNHRRPVFQLCYEITPEDALSFRLELLSSRIDEPYTVEQTRALVHYYQQRPLGGRTLSDRFAGLHEPSWTELGLPEPERTTAPPLY